MAFYEGETYSCHETAGSASAGTKADYVLDRIAKYFPVEAPRHLLDYGAGGGGFLLHAQRRGWKVQGFEPGQRGPEHCRRAGLEVTDNLEELPSGEFSLITLHHVFEHLHNPLEALQGIRRLLAAGGRLYIEVPNVRSLRARLAVPFLSRRFSVDERYRAFPIHLMYYSDRTLRRMLEQAGWSVDASLTLGMGLDEFFVEAKDSKESQLPDQPETAAPETAAAPPRSNRRWRHGFRDAFLNWGLGENLAVIASPK